MTAVLELDQVHLSLGGRPILRGLDLQVQAGEHVVLVGANGCGKSTALRVLIGEVRPDAGRVSLLGRTLTSMSRREVAQQVAVLHQQLPAVPGLTVRQLVAQGRYPQRSLWSMLADPEDDSCQEALDLTGTARFADRLVDSLSGGERQRVRLALAVAQRTPVLVLDEPTTYLDVRHQLDVLHLVDELRRARDLTVVSVLHDLDQAVAHADRLVVVSQGRAAACGPAASTLTPELMLEAFGVHGRLLHDPVAGRDRIVVDRPVRDGTSRKEAACSTGV